MKYEFDTSKTKIIGNGDKIIVEVEDEKPERWRAKKFDDYFFIDSTLKIVRIDDAGSNLNDKLYKIGNYFKTREATQKVLDQIKPIFLNSEAE